MGIAAQQVEGVGHVEQGAEGQGDGQHDQRVADVVHHGHQRLGQAGDQFDADGKDQRRYHVGQPADHPMVLDVRLPAQLGGAERLVQAAHQDVIDQPVGQPGDRQQQHGGAEGEQQRLALQPVEPVGELVDHG
ncbi:hypothetical protein D3C81_1861690 [compost metagenome]